MMPLADIATVAGLLRAPAARVGQPLELEHGPGPNPLTAMRVWRAEKTQEHP